MRQATPGFWHHDYAIAWRKKFPRQIGCGYFSRHKVLGLIPWGWTWNTTTPQFDKAWMASHGMFLPSRLHVEKMIKGDPEEQQLEHIARRRPRA